MNSKWVKVKLREIVSEFIVPMRDKPKKFGGDIPWCRIEDFNGIYLSKSKSGKTVDEQTIKEMKLRVYPTNTVLVSCSADLGRCAITTAPLVTNQTFIGLVPTPRVDSLFLYFLMTYSADRLNDLSTGTTISYLSRRQFENFTITIPTDILEQKKIAQNLLNVVDGIEKTDKIIQRTEELKSGLMSSLLTKGIGHTKFKKTEVGEIPKDWNVINFLEIAELQRGFDLPAHNRTKGVYPLVSSNGITDTNNEYKVSTPGVVTGRSGTIGKVFYIEENFWPLNTTLYIKNFHDNYPKYIYYLLININLKRFLGGTGVPTLNRNIIHDIKVAFPSSIAEQRKISEILDQIYKKIENEKVTKEKLLLEKNGMMSNIFSKEMK